MFLRARASITARISYGNSVRPSVRLSACPGVTTRYRSKTKRDKDFGFSSYDSLESLVFRDKISCRWVEGSPRTGERKKGTNASLKSRFGVSVTLQRSQGDATQLTRYAIAHVYTWQRKMLNLNYYERVQTVLLGPSLAYAKIKTFSSVAGRYFDDKIVNV